jgi:hypothetical protein
MTDATNRPGRKTGAPAKLLRVLAGAACDLVSAAQRLARIRSAGQAEGSKERSPCPRCGSYLRGGNGPSEDNPHGLCDPCLRLVASCAPFVDRTAPDQAPPDVNLIELVAGLALIHDALHPGKPLHLREALAAHGVEADHVKVWQTVGKLRRRHGLVLRGEPRESGAAREVGYRVVDWLWEAKRVRSSLQRRMISSE